MVSKPSAGGSRPQTLWQAHELLARVRPRRDASDLTWLKFYQRSVAVYAEVAEIDRGHHHEAMYWVAHERKRLNEFQAKLQLAKALDPPVVETVKEPETVHKEQ